MSVPGRRPAPPAPAASALVAHCIELLSPLGPVRARRMFGGHGLYLDELFIAIIAFDRLYLKADAGTAPRFAAAGCEPFVYDGGARPVTLNYWTVPAEALDSPDAMAPWARLAQQAALAARAAALARKPAGRKAAASEAAGRKVAGKKVAGKKVVGRQAATVKPAARRR